MPVAISPDPATIGMFTFLCNMLDSVAISSLVKPEAEIVVE